MITRADTSNHGSNNDPEDALDAILASLESEFSPGLFRSSPTSQPREEDDIIDRMLDAGVAKLQKGVVRFSRAVSGICFATDNRSDADAEAGLAHIIDIQRPETYPGVSGADGLIVSNIRRRGNGR